MTNMTSAFAVLFQPSGRQFFNNAMNTLTSMSSQMPVPLSVINNLKEAIRLNFPPAVACMAEVLLTRQAPMGYCEKISYLRLVTESNKDAAYTCALAYAGLGESYPVDYKKAASYFLAAARLGHEGAFSKMMEEISNNKIHLPPEFLVQICKEFYTQAKDYKAAVVYSCFVCGYKPYYYPRINIVVPKDPMEGFSYLVNTASHGPNEIALDAQRLILIAYEDNVFPMDNPLVKELYDDYQKMFVEEESNKKGF